MGFLSKLFDSPRNTARKEIEKRIELMGNGQSTGGEVLLTCVIGPATSFIPTFIDNDSKKKQQYLSDEVLYELAVYRLFRADCYIFLKYEDLRERYMQFLFRETAKLFSSHIRLSENALGSIINDRLAVYGDMFAKNSEPMNFFDILIQAIADTVASGEPREGLMDRPPLFLDALDVFAIKSALVSWVTNFLPIVCESLDNIARVSRSC